jgi:hypothetical protein
MAGEPQRLVFVMGSLRSGTTLLSTLMGSLPDVLNAGELRLLWKQLDEGVWLCGCGTPISDCDFWKDVVAASGLSVPEMATLSREYQQSRLRVRRLRQFARETTVGPLDTEYGNAMQSLVDGLRSVSGRGIILDSSKVAPDAVAYHRFTNEDVAAVHVVRDPRAVAHSMSRRKTHPMRDGMTRPMVRMSARKSVSFWITMNLGADIAAAALPVATRVRYEAACEDPAGTVGTLARFIGASMPDDVFNSDGEFLRRPEHTVAGNPNRFTTGRERVRLDDRWRSEMPRWTAAAIAASTWPLMRRYGY